MKLYVRSAYGVDENYENIKPKHAVSTMVKIELSSSFRSDTIPNLISGILSWKQSTGCDFHHFDKDTSNNFSGNIYLIDKNAHGYLHSRSTEDKFFRLFGLVDRNVKEQGRYRDKLRSEMWEHVKDAVGEHGCMSTVMGILVDNRVDIEKNNSEEFIQDILDDGFSSGKIGKITIDLIDDILNNSGIDYSKQPDATYIDDEVGKRVLKFLDNLKDEGFNSKMHTKSIDELRKFILNNPTTRQQLSDDYYAGLWEHSK